eukprot:Sspe_Gene.55062::Locus_30325_Transcript_1_1_Confidence_1.000_Length_4083::g.55062::m.55062
MGKITCGMAEVDKGSFRPLNCPTTPPHSPRCCGAAQTPPSVPRVGVDDDYLPRSQSCPPLTTLISDADSSVGDVAEVNAFPSSPSSASLGAFEVPPRALDGAHVLDTPLASSISMYSMPWGVPDAFLCPPYPYPGYFYGPPPVYPFYEYCDPEALREDEKDLPHDRGISFPLGADTEEAAHRQRIIWEQLEGWGSLCMAMRQSLGMIEVHTTEARVRESIVVEEGVWRDQCKEMHSAQHALLVRLENEASRHALVALAWHEQDCRSHISLEYERTFGKLRRQALVEASSASRSHAEVQATEDPKVAYRTQRQDLEENRQRHTQELKELLAVQRILLFASSPLLHDEEGARMSIVAEESKAAVALALLEREGQGRITIEGLKHELLQRDLELQDYVNKHSVTE